MSGIGIGLVLARDQRLDQEALICDQKVVNLEKQVTGMAAEIKQFQGQSAEVLEAIKRMEEGQKKQMESDHWKSYHKDE
jgi:hypothetical protein